MDPTVCHLNGWILFFGWETSGNATAGMLVPSGTMATMMTHSFGGKSQ